MNSEVGMDCSGRQCGYGEFSGDLGCTDGSSCFHAGLLKASESKFHDAALAKATSQINEIIASVPKDASGRQLSFLHTPYGTMLAWVRHDVDVPKDAVKASSPKDQVAKSLGLIDPPLRD